MQDQEKKILIEKSYKSKLEERKKSKKILSPKELLDPKQLFNEIPNVIEDNEPECELIIDTDNVESNEYNNLQESIDQLRERIEEISLSIIDLNYYDEEIIRLENLISNKIEIDDIDLKPLNSKINRLKKYISRIPEVKYYDQDLEKLSERIDQLQISGSEIFNQHGENLKEIKKVIHQMLNDLDILSELKIPEQFDPSYLENDLVSIKEIFYERISEIKKQISNLPQVKYYDEELQLLKDKIDNIKQSIPEIPEIKSYDEDLKKLSKAVEEVRHNIQQLPEVKYYESEISSLENSIKNIENFVINIPEIKYYDKDISLIKDEINKVDSKIKFYDEDIEILDEKIKKIENNSSVIKKYDDIVENLSEEINQIAHDFMDIKLSIKLIENTVNVVKNKKIPEQFDPSGIQIEIENVYKEIEKLKQQPVNLKEDVDPLLPLDQKFVTFDDLAQHYRIFINRVQQQLSSLGGGGEVNLRYLDDIDRSSIANGRVLSYDSNTKKFVFISQGAATSLWNETIEGNIYRNSYVGINTDNPTTDLDIIGNVNVVGIITSSTFSGDFISNLDKTLQYYSNTGSLSTITTSNGSKTFYYDNNGVLTNIVGTGLYPSKIFNYDTQGNLIFIDIV